MENPLEPLKLEAALEALQAEKERRTAAKVEAGEAVRQELVIIVGGLAEATPELIEKTRAAKLATIRAAGEKRDVIFDEPTIVVTGVPRAPDFCAIKSDAPQAWPSAPESPSVTVAPLLSVSPVENIDSTYVWVTKRPPKHDDDPGEVMDGYYSVTDGELMLTDSGHRHLASRKLRQGEAALDVARQLLRKAAPNDFYRSIKYPGLGIV